MEGAPCEGSVKESATDSWVIGEGGSLVQWRSAGPWEWTYHDDSGAFYLYDPRHHDAPPVVIAKDWLETEGAYEQVAPIVDALADSLATCPYAVLKAGEVINPLVFESDDGEAWYCSAQALLTDVLKPYFPRQVVEKLSARDPDGYLNVGFYVTKDTRALQTTQIRQEPSPPAPEIVCTWIRLGPSGA